MDPEVKPFTVILPVEAHDALSQLARETAAKEKSRVGASDLVRRALAKEYGLDVEVRSPGQP